VTGNNVAVPLESLNLHVGPLVASFADLKRLLTRKGSAPKREGVQLALPRTTVHDVVKMVQLAVDSVSGTVGGGTGGGFLQLVEECITDGPEFVKVVANEVGISGWVSVGGTPFFDVDPAALMLHVGPIEVSIEALKLLKKRGLKGGADVEPIEVAIPRVSIDDLVNFLLRLIDELGSSVKMATVMVGGAEDDEDASDGLLEDVTAQFKEFFDLIENSTILHDWGEFVAVSGTLRLGGAKRIELGEVTLYLGPMEIQIDDFGAIADKKKKHGAEQVLLRQLLLAAGGAQADAD
jgi:hypothetical protein